MVKFVIFTFSIHDSDYQHFGTPCGLPGQVTKDENLPSEVVHRHFLAFAKGHPILLPFQNAQNKNKGYLIHMEIEELCFQTDNRNIHSIIETVC